MVSHRCRTICLPGLWPLFYLLIRCYDCHCKIGESAHHHKDIFLTSFLWSIVVKSKLSISNGWLSIKDPCFTFGSLYGPLAFLHLLQVFTQLLTSRHTVLQKNLSLMRAIVCPVLWWPFSSCSNCSTWALKTAGDIIWWYLEAWIS